ncbi:carbohydrate ABC transporter permease [Sinomonas gamaensis]|jgi:glucose/mannose transport system permease protein|uniref:carbohydrate ABC transporter permease n=1 Tax=Sinomonas gamaensis TaxID=2565624 RepID=UPI00110822D9|nr:sugar ABC transporter permease [Sinomonas gamaensis]
MTVVAAPSERRQAVQRRRRRLKGDRLASVLVLVPSMIAIAVFVYVFVAWTMYTSVINWTGIVPDSTLVGFKNFARLFGDSRFLIDLRNLGLFSASFIVQCLVIGFALAALINSKIRIEGLFRTIFILPFAISPVVTGVIWHWLLDPQAGVNSLLRSAGLGFLANGWYTDSTWGILSVSVAAAWQMSGYVMALYLAGLRALPQELMEAAVMDGCGTWALYRRIVIPLLKPVTFSAVIITGMLSIKLFDLIASMTGSGPAFAEDTLGFNMYQLAFSSNRFSLSAAVAVVMILIATVLLVPHLMSVERKAKR